MPIVLLALVACQPTPKSVDSAAADDSAAPFVRPGLAGLDDLGVRNVIIVHVDTLRADHLANYGYARETLPLTGSFPWLVMNGLYATASWTLPSTSSVMSALDVQHHGVTHMMSNGHLNAALTAPKLAEHLGEQGYATLVMSGNDALTQVVGELDGFDEVVQGPQDLGDMLPVLEPWVEANDDSPFLVFLQPMDAHDPYRPGDFLGTWSDPDTLPFDVNDDREGQLASYRAAVAAATTDAERDAIVQQLRDVYDEDLLGFDSSLARLFDWLAASGHSHDTLVVLAGDHGESLGEEQMNFFGHGGTVRQELVRVPLMFLAQNLPAGRVDCLAQNTDIAPTVLQALGLPPMTDVDGQTLQDHCRTAVYSSTFMGDVDPDALAELATSDGTSMLRWSCTEDHTWRYDLTADPAGLTDVPSAAFTAGAWLGPLLTDFQTDLESTFGPLPCTHD